MLIVRNFFDNLFEATVLLNNDCCVVSIVGADYPLTTYLEPNYVGIASEAKGKKFPQLRHKGMGSKAALS